MSIALDCVIIVSKTFFTYLFIFELVQTGRRRISFATDIEQSTSIIIHALQNPSHDDNKMKSLFIPDITYHQLVI